MNALQYIAPRFRLLLAAGLVAALSGCSTFTSTHSLSYTDPQGNTVEKSYTVTAQQHSNGTWYASDGLTADGVLGQVPYGATVNISGTVTAYNAAGALDLGLATLECATQKGCATEQAAILEAIQTSGASSDAANAAKARFDACLQPAIATYVEQCNKEVHDRSYSVTCPTSCAGKRLPNLVVGENFKLSCACPTKPPLCTDSRALNELNADGEPAWSTCTPVELPILKADKMNDALLKQMMRGSGCTLVYSFVLHQYVCQ